MSRGDEVRTTAHNVLHAAFGPKSVRHKDCSVRTFVPHREAAHADLEEKHDPAVAMMQTGIAGYNPMRNKATRFESRSHLS